MIGVGVISLSLPDFARIPVVVSTGARNALEIAAAPFFQRRADSDELFCGVPTLHEAAATAFTAGW